MSDLAGSYGVESDGGVGRNTPIAEGAGIAGVRLLDDLEFELNEPGPSRTATTAKLSARAKIGLQCGPRSGKLGPLRLMPNPAPDSVICVVRERPTNGSCIRGALGDAVGCVDGVGLAHRELIIHWLHRV